MNKRDFKDRVAEQLGWHDFEEGGTVSLAQVKRLARQIANSAEKQFPQATWQQRSNRWIAGELATEN